MIRFLTKSIIFNITVITRTQWHLFYMAGNASYPPLNGMRLFTHLHAPRISLLFLFKNSFTTPSNLMNNFIACQQTGRVIATINFAIENMFGHQQCTMSG